MRRLILGLTVLIAACSGGQSPITAPTQTATIQMTYKVNSPFGGTAVVSDFTVIGTGTNSLAMNSTSILHVPPGNYTIQLDTTYPEGYKSSSCTVSVAADAVAQCSLVADEIPLTCDSSLHQFLYNDRGDERLKPLSQGCMTLTGSFSNWVLSDDGDIVIDFGLDPRFASLGLINDFNIKDNHGYFVVEFICQDTTKETECKGYNGPRLSLPPPDQLRANPIHAKIVVQIVQDMLHHWIEGHPATKLVILPR